MYWDNCCLGVVDFEFTSGGVRLSEATLCISSPEATMKGILVEALTGPGVNTVTAVA